MRLEDYIIGMGFSVGFLIRAYFFRTKYIKLYGVCLENSLTNKAFAEYSRYEYEIEEYGKIVIYQNWGSACFRHKVGKKYRLLVNKKNHNKIVAYNKYVTILITGIIILLWLVFDTLVRYDIIF